MSDSGQGITGAKKKTLRTSLFGKLRGYFLTGILITAPIGITLYLTVAFINAIDSTVTPLIPPRYNPGTYFHFTLHGLGFIVALVFFILVGWFAHNFLGRFFIRLSETVMNRMPVVNRIYRTIKQIFETVMASQSKAFREVVFVEYPRPGLWALGFVTGAAKGGAQNLPGGEEMVNVLLPLALNPTSAVLLFVPRKDLRPADMNVEQAFKMIISGGIIAPTGSGPDKRKAS